MGDGYTVRYSMPSRVVFDRPFDSVASASPLLQLVHKKPFHVCQPETRQGLSLMHCNRGETISATTRGDVHTCPHCHHYTTAQKEWHSLVCIQISQYLTEALCESIGIVIPCCPQELAKFQPQRVDKWGHVTGWISRNLSKTILHQKSNYKKRALFMQNRLHCFNLLYF